MMRNLITMSVNLCMGILIGIMFHYFLYRFSLPAKAFIYVSF